MKSSTPAALGNVANLIPESCGNFPPPVLGRACLSFWAFCVNALMLLPSFLISVTGNYSIPFLRNQSPYGLRAVKPPFLGQPVQMKI